MAKVTSSSEAFQGFIEWIKGPALKYSLILNGILLAGVILGSILVARYFEKSKRADAEKITYEQKIKDNQAELQRLRQKGDELLSEFARQKKQVEIAHAELQEVNNRYASVTNWVQATSLYRGDIVFSVIK